MSATASTPIPLTRLIRIELRKAVDTRSGLALALTVAGLTIALLIAGAAGGFGEQSGPDLLKIAQVPASVLLPFVGLLLISAEFTTRTALTTFVLVPSRGRVVAAKLVAALGIGVIAALFLWAAAWLAAIPAPDPDVAAPLGLSDTGWRVGLDLVIGIAGGFAFGLLIRNTPAAIVSLIFVPTLITGIFTAVPALRDAVPWLTATASGFGQDGDDPSSWAQLATTFCVFTLLPLLAGLWRLGRSEIS